MFRHPLRPLLLWSSDGRPPAPGLLGAGYDLYPQNGDIVLRPMALPGTYAAVWNDKHRGLLQAMLDECGRPAIYAPLQRHSLRVLVLLLLKVIGSAVRSPRLGNLNHNLGDRAGRV